MQMSIKTTLDKDQTTVAKLISYFFKIINPAA